jgi:acyl-CoA synthetase (AMP-forming)/AMP-acid ligase II
MARVPTESETTAALLAGLPQRLHEIVLRHARTTPDAPALHEAAATWTYGELARAVQQAAELLRELEVRPGDRLMIVSENCMLQVALIFACSCCDAWAVCVNARLAAPELDAIRAHCGARRVLYTGAVSPEAAAHAARHDAPTRTLALLGSFQVGPLNAAAQCEPLSAEAHAQVAALVYTTGTTGAPKAVMLSHRNLLFIAASSSALRGVTPEDRVYGVLPISHVYGLASVMLGTLDAGACLHLVPRYAPQALLQALRTQRLTMLQGVPAMYARLLEHVKQTQAEGTAPGFDRLTDAPALHFIYAGGSPLDPTLKHAVQQLFGQPLHNGYGLTESAPTISQTRRAAPRTDTSVGPVIPGVELRIVDAAGTVLAAGEIGELQVRGPNVMLGYYRDPLLSAQALLPQGWLATGDLARQDAEGALFIVGRSKELIIRSGFNVYPVEVEAALNTHPAVVQSAVVGRKVAGGNEEVVAFVELDRALPVELAALHEHVAGRLSPYKRPGEIVVLPALPAAATGKVLKARLQQLAQHMYDTRD